MIDTSAEFELGPPRWEPVTLPLDYRGLLSDCGGCPVRNSSSESNISCPRLNCGADNDGVRYNWTHYQQLYAIKSQPCHSGFDSEICQNSLDTSMAFRFRYVTPDSALTEVTKVSARWSIQSEDDGIAVYRSRWLMLGIIVLCAISNAVHWLQYAIISRIAEEYYGVSSLVIAWTAMMFSVTFIIFVFPAAWMIERLGLKIMLIAGDILMIIGSWMKLVSVEPQLFYVGFVGQIIVGMAQVAIVNVPSYVAGLWFPANEVSTACAIGVLATQIGVAISFLVPPLVVMRSHDMQLMRRQFFWLYVSFSILPTLILPIIVFYFKNVPPRPPSFSRFDSLKRKNNKREEKIRKLPATKELLTDLITNKNYLLVVVSYSLILATNYCISTLLNIILDYHFLETEKAGAIGTILVVVSIFGCFFFGWILDKTHKFKLMAVIAYSFSIVGLELFWLGMYLSEYHMLILSAMFMGFFLASYVIIAIEFASELTYPISETISSSILLSCGEFTSIILIYMSTKLYETYGEITVVYTTTAFMIAGWIVTLLISPSTETLKRYEASFSRSPSSVNGLNIERSQANTIVKNQRTASNIQSQGPSPPKVQTQIPPRVQPITSNDRTQSPAKDRKQS